MDIDKVRSALESDTALYGWMMRHVESASTTAIRLPWLVRPEGEQLRRTPNRRPREVISAPSEEVWLTIYARHRDEGGWRMGESAGQLLSDEDTVIRDTIDGLLAAARGQSNEPYSLVDGTSPYPAVEIVDPALMAASIPELADRAQAFAESVLQAAEKEEAVEVSNLEVFLTRAQTTLETSAGARVARPSTRADAEICVIARLDQNRVAEHTARPHARCLADLDPAAHMPAYADYARGIAGAGPPLQFRGPVAIVGDALADVFSIAGSPISFHASARQVHEKMSRYARGGPATGTTEVTGDAVTLASDPLIAMGPRSQSFSTADGSPARRVELLRSGLWHDLLGTRRYFDYLGLSASGVAPSGPIGNTVLGAGTSPADELLAGDRWLVVKALSDFQADPVSGDFACEIRLGELWEHGKPAPFKGGLLIGNYFEALAGVRLSRETCVAGEYHGPSVARFAQLTVAG